MVDFLRDDLVIVEVVLPFSSLELSLTYLAGFSTRCAPRAPLIYMHAIPNLNSTI